MGNGGRSDRRRVQNRLLDKRGRVYRSEVMRMFASGSASDGDDSDGLDFYQHFVLSQFWDGNLLENDVFALALRSSVPEVEQLRLTRSSRTSLTRALQVSGMCVAKSDIAVVDVAQPRPATSS